MNTPQISAEDVIDFLVATLVSVMGMEAQRTNPVGSGESSLDDACMRLFYRFEATNDGLCLEVKTEVCLNY